MHCAHGRRLPHGTVQIVAVANGFTKADAQRLIRACRKPPPQRKQHRTVASLTADERREVRPGTTRIEYIRVSNVRRGLLPTPGIVRGARLGSMLR